MYKGTWAASDTRGALLSGALNTCTGSYRLTGAVEVLAIAAWLEVAAFPGCPSAQHSYGEPFAMSAQHQLVTQSWQDGPITATLYQHRTADLSTADLHHHHASGCT